MSTDKAISTKELKNWIDERKDFVLIDTLPANSYEAHHIPTAQHADVKGRDFMHRIEQAAPDKAKPVVLYCLSAACTLTPSAQQKLAKTGYTNVYSYDGGLADWQDAGFSFEGDEAPKKVSLVCDCKGCGCE